MSLVSSSLASFASFSALFKASLAFTTFPEGRKLFSKIIRKGKEKGRVRQRNCAGHGVFKRKVHPFVFLQLSNLLCEGEITRERIFFRTFPLAGYLFFVHASPQVRRVCLQASYSVKESTLIYQVFRSYLPN